MSKLSKTSPKKFWKKVNSFRKGKLSSSDRVSLESFVDHFKHISNTPHTDKIFDVPDVDATPININELDLPISFAEISKAIDSMKRGKSPGIDGLVSDFFIDAKEFLVPYLYRVYNFVFETGNYPKIWSEGLIVPIPKKGDLSNPSNYRGITLISTFAKLFSLIIRKGVNQWCENQNILDENQFGFRDSRSTADCIFILQSLIQKSLDNKSKLYCAFVDYEKAFDTIIHDAMWIKLINSGISSKIVTIIKSIYRKITASIKLNSDISSCFDICLGLKQGEPLSPLLFVIFINDVRQQLQNGPEGTIEGIDLERLCFFVLLFADDMVLFSNSPDELQILLNRLYSYSTYWGLNVNTSKTKICIFEKQRQNIDRIWKYNNEDLEIVDAFCYLGVKLYYTGNLEMTTKTLSVQAARAANNLLALFKRLSFDVKTKLALFDSLVTPIILYGAEVWGIYDIKNVDRIHIKFFKAILGVKQQTPNNAVYGELGRYPLSVISKERSFKFWIHILKQKDTNSPVFNVYQYMFNRTTSNPQTKSWASLIKSELGKLGLSYMWNRQNEIIPRFTIIQQRLRDQYIQKWKASLSSMSKLDSYIRYKNTFEMEKYLQILSNDTLRKHLTSLRLVSHRLQIEIGRHNDLARAERVCRVCNVQQTESEYHFMLVCPAYRDLRVKFLPRYCMSWPTLNKFDYLMKQNGNKILTNVAKFISAATKLRSEMLV